jgi:hypothetical protein
MSVRVTVQLKVPCPGAESPPSSLVVTSEVTMPAIEAMLITRDGMLADVPFNKRSCSLKYESVFAQCVNSIRRTQRSLIIN